MYYIVHKPYYVGDKPGKWNTIDGIYSTYEKALERKKKLIEHNPHWENLIVIEEVL